MLPLTIAKQVLLKALQDMTGCDYVRAQQLNANNNERVESTPADKKTLAILSQQKEEFTSACCIEKQGFQFDISIVSDSFIQIIIQRAETSTASQNESRRKDIQIDRQSNAICIDFVNHSGTVQWFTDLAQGEATEYTNAQAGLLSQLHAISLSFDLFKNYQKFAQDSLTKLQSRNALQNAIDAQIENANMILCMIHCRDFQVVNRKFGQAKGDQVLHEIATIINHQTRNHDLACRFGGALFGIATHANSIEEGKALANKIQHELHSRPYLNNAIRLTFNIGVAICCDEDHGHDDSPASSILISRAEQALRAAQTSDKPSVVAWEVGKFDHDEQDFNYLGGIFTPDNVTNYRNMLLLWDISSIIADEHSFQRLLFNVIERLAYTFEFEYAGILSDTAELAHDIMISIKDMDNIHQQDIKTLPFLSILMEHRIKAISSNQPQEMQDEERRYLMVPLGANNKECFFLVGDKRKLDLTHDSIMLFAGFARQIGKALNRSQLEEQLNRKLEQQNAILAQELEELKSGLKSSALVYRSEIMQKLMTQTQRAAQTETTVLITGESGTGKEKLINAVHSLSDRTHKSPIIVDCGSIPETLIESELFGHMKGAFTGAQSEKVGKIQAADTGILVLDEIGELPLSMQPKLLRFVQEKHFTPVGGTKQIKVDVKIVAVTNRDLFEEVKAGKFRQDLYYRLNVVRLHNPPLRERIDDLELLCHHFLSKFSKQYDVDRKFLSKNALNNMSKYHWPGNVRQLENLLMQACLLSENNEITYEELNIDAQNELFPKQMNAHQQSEPHHSTLNAHNAETNTNGHHSHDTQTTLNSDDISQVESDEYELLPEHIAMSHERWIILFDEALNEFVQDINQSINHYNLNIGDTLEAHIFKGLSKHFDTNKKIAERMRIPISTARRKAQRFVDARIPTTLPDSWHQVQALLDKLITSEVVVQEPLPLIKHTLVKVILNKVTVNMTRAASMVGVSEPTLYKMKKNLSVIG